MEDKELFLKCNRTMVFNNPIGNMMIIESVDPIEYIEVKNLNRIKGMMYMLMFGLFYLLAVLIVASIVLGLVLFNNTHLMVISASYLGFNLVRVLFLTISCWVDFWNYPSWRKKITVVKNKK